MASTEVTGAGPTELVSLEWEYYETPLYREDGVPFETAYCLNPIARQPDFYDGPQRHCKRRAAKKDDDRYEGGPREPQAFAICCHSHGGDNVKHGEEQAHRLNDPRTSNLKHGAYAEDEHLKMDFTDNEQELHDSIMNDWPEIYGWPPESEDPARYRILRRVAVNEVRAEREEDYLEDEGEIYKEPQYDERGEVIGYQDTENPLSREYRLLMKEVTSQMKELGLTPKEQQKMDTMASQADKDDALSEIAREALNTKDKEYDPDQFGE
jgi:hypothetical protein